MKNDKRIKIAFLTCNNDFGNTGLEIAKSKNVNIVYENFGNKDLNLRTVKFDYLISLCYSKRVSKNDLALAKVANINFHPAPLPMYRGFAVYNFGILNEEKEWGTTAHIMEEKFDSGSIIKSNKFPIELETAYSLRSKSRVHLLQLFEEVLDDLVSGKEMQYQENVGGKYYSKKMMNEERIISLKDSEQVVDKKIRAFWCPPYSGAALKIGKKEFTLVNNDIIKSL